MKKKSHVFRGVASIFLALMVILGIVGQVANNWAGKVNELLGVSDATIERSQNPADYLYLSDFQNPADLLQAEIDLNTRLSVEGSVVLKGDPAIGGTNVTLLGMRSGEKMQFGGSMGELIDAKNVVTLETAMRENGFSVNPDMVQFYKDMEADYEPSRASGGNVVSDYEGQGAEVGEVPVSAVGAVGVDGYTDAAVIVLGRDAGESCCFYPGLNGLSNPDEFTNSPTGNILSLSNDERDLVSWARSQGFGKIVVLLNSGTSMEIEELKADDAIDSIVWIGNPGAYGTYGIAKLLSGEALPSGHLPDTFAVNSALSPAAQNYGIYTFTNAADIETTTNNALRSDWYLVEAEGIYTGYKYYETRYYDTVVGQGNAAKAEHGETADGGSVWDYDNEVSYTFGYGVEGSAFAEEIVESEIDWSGETDSVFTVRVTNAGDTAAKHVVQLYVSLPYTDNDRKNGVEKSAIQLIGYAKTGEASESSYADVVLLEPGQSEDVTIAFNAQDIYTYDRTYAHDGVYGAWSLEAGEYYFATGNGAHEAVQAVLQEQGYGSFDLTGDVRVETLPADVYRTAEGDVIVQNRLDMADLNTMNTGTTVTYLTRNDWAGTFPVSIEGVTATDEMIYMLRNATYNQAVEMTSYNGPASFTYEADNGVKAVDLIGLDYNDPMYDRLLDELSLEYLINQYLCLLNENPVTAMPKENSADSPLGFIATIGQRSGGTIYEVAQDDPAFGHQTNVYAGAPVVAASFSPLLQREEGRLIANDALWDGYSVWYGPGLNLHRTPYNGRNIAYYSEDPVLTGVTGAYVHHSLYKYGIITSTKHFAFNDQETNREGVAVFLNEQAARENELRGFQIPIREGSLKGIMSAFNRIGCTHVGADKGLMNGILRGEWGWNGYLMTDSVKSASYFQPRECLMAGNDLMLGASNNGKVWGFTADEIRDDIVVQNALRESYHRKLYSYANSALLNGITPDSASDGSVVWWVLMLRIGMGLSFVGFAAFLVLFIVRDRKERRA